MNLGGAPYDKRLLELRNLFENRVLKKVGDNHCRVNGAVENPNSAPAVFPPICRLPNTSNLSFLGVQADRLLSELEGYLVASACDNSNTRPPRAPYWFPPPPLRP